jgi:Acyl-CoA dehydrogenase, C-terminal domain
MDLSLSADQRTVLDALDALTRPYAQVPIGDHSFALAGAALERELEENGFLDVARDSRLGAVTAAIIVERLARLPFATGVGVRALVGTLLGNGLVGPVCVIEADKKAPLVRSLCAEAYVVVVGTDSVEYFIARADQVRPEPEALYGYPVATLIAPGEAVPRKIDPETVRTRWRIALAAEAAGLLAAALQSVCAYTSERNQFGRPLASFQGMRHRLAEAQVRTNGVYWLAMKAAASLDPADAAMAALHAQESARATVYDFHQFMGAMGMTLEHPLHLWTYRLKFLISELGGRGNQALAAADALWG